MVFCFQCWDIPNILVIELYTRSVPTATEGLMPNVRRNGVSNAALPIPVTPTNPL